MIPIDMVRAAAHERATTLVSRLSALVQQESPPASPRELTACADLLDAWGSAVLGRPAQRIILDGLPHLLWPAADQAVLLLGHFDTVWPAGTIEEWPFSVTGDIATGPGVCDMKAGIVQLLTALELIADTDRVGVLLTCDEESGSPASRPLIEEQARRSGAVLVCEPSTEAGELKVARKGGSLYRIGVHGRAAHAGVEPHLGVNAAIELAHQVLAVRELATEDTTVTPTVLSGGTMTNVVPEKAQLCVDVRAWTRGELDRVDRMMRGLAPRLPGARLEISGGVNRYPLQTTVTLPLFEQAQIAAKEIGLAPLEAARAPGASDANFTGSLGIATLDGLGGVGGGSHARGEYVNIAQMPDRTALLAALIERVLAAPTTVNPRSQSTA